jgi:hypothetical protein
MIFSGGVMNFDYNSFVNAGLVFLGLGAIVGIGYCASWLIEKYWEQETYKNP